MQLWRATSAVLILLTSHVSARLVGVPTLPNFQPQTGVNPFILTNIKSILVDPAYANSVDNQGQTLIPPTLLSFAQTFAADLGQIFNLSVVVAQATSSTEPYILLSLDTSSTYLNAAGKSSSEGYTLTVNANSIVVRGASPLGAWWGTRTILQQAVINGGKVIAGTGKDTPGWPTRGMMLDVARKYYPPAFIIEMCSYMSFFKQNTFHLHLTDNLPYDANSYSQSQQLNNIPARFRLWSDDPAVSGLNKNQNESYTRSQFDSIQQQCASRGVTILPEIEAPGHALVIVKWKPQLGMAGDLSLLDLSKPESTTTMKTIWRTFLDWFHVKTVHIGADEYTGDPAAYTAFVNTMSEFISTTSGKAVRIWGTFVPNDQNGYPDQNVTVQHWAFFEANPYTAFIQQGYTVLNSDDGFYVVNKYSESYPQKLNIARTFGGNPAGGPWYPHVLDGNNAYNNPERSTPSIIGGIAALWNDYGQDATVPSEAYFAWRDGLPALADKQWGSDITQTEYNTIFDTLLNGIPAQNLDRKVRTQGSTIFDYQFGNTDQGSRNSTTTSTAAPMPTSSRLVRRRFRQSQSSSQWPWFFWWWFFAQPLHNPTSTSSVVSSALTSSISQSSTTVSGMATTTMAMTTISPSSTTTRSTTSSIVATSSTTTTRSTTSTSTTTTRSTSTTTRPMTSTTTSALRSSTTTTTPTLSTRSSTISSSTIRTSSSTTTSSTQTSLTTSPSTSSSPPSSSPRTSSTTGSSTSSTRSSSTMSTTTSTTPSSMTRSTTTTSSTLKTTASALSTTMITMSTSSTASSSSTVTSSTASSVSNPRVLDRSSNEYHGVTNCQQYANGSILINASCQFTTPLQSKGRDYTLILGILVSTLPVASASGTLVTGNDSSLVLTSDRRIGLLASGTTYFPSQSSVISMNTWTNITIIGQGAHTYLKINNGQQLEFTTTLKNLQNGRQVTKEIAIEAPIYRIGGAGAGWTGQVNVFKLTS